MTDTKVKAPRRGRCRKVTVGVAAAMGSVLAGAGTTFATPTPTEEATEAAGTAIGDLVDQGIGFIGTYAIPAAGLALGIGLVLSLLVRLGRKVRGWVG